jgi:methylenetetrahydrofolate reductase (NADPH)
VKISALIKDHFTYSFEVFPPKQDKPLEPLLNTLSHLYAYHPDFISCTYGAGGTNKGRNAEICQAIQSNGAAETLSHFTCIGNSRQSLEEGLACYQKMGIQNLLALRGDLPADWNGTRGDFSHADQLMDFLKTSAPDFCIGGACYPEKHLQAASFESDIDALKRKQASGAEFLTTQLCYDLDALARFLDRVQRSGVTLPIIAGVMPVLSKDGLIRMTLSNGCSIPAELAAIIGRYGNQPEEFKKAGKAYTVRLLHRVRALQVSGIHVYTMNRYEDVSDILTASGVPGDQYHQ